MEILQLLCVTWTMNKGDPNYEHFAEHGSSGSVFQCIPVSIETTHQSHDYVKWADMWVNNTHI